MKNRINGEITATARTLTNVVDVDPDFLADGTAVAIHRDDDVTLAITPTVEITAGGDEAITGWGWQELGDGEPLDAEVDAEGDLDDLHEEIAGWARRTGEYA